MREFFTSLKMALEEGRNVRNKLITITLAVIFMIKNSGLFCCVCGSFTIGAQRRSITPDLKKIYKLYFGCLLEDDDNKGPRIKYALLAPVACKTD